MCEYSIGKGLNSLYLECGKRPKDASEAEVWLDPDDVNLSDKDIFGDATSDDTEDTNAGNSI